MKRVLGHSDHKTLGQGYHQDPQFDWGNFGNVGRKLLPSIIFVVFSLLAVTSLMGIPGLTPNFGLMALFHWAIYRSLPTFLFVVVGVMQDAILGHYLGHNVFILTFMYLVITSQRRYILRQNFWIIWWVFSSMALAEGVFNQLISGLFQVTFVHFHSWLLQTLLTIAFYPFVVKLFVYVHRLMD